jgi:hypothetical protein
VIICGSYLNFFPTSSTHADANNRMTAEQVSYFFKSFDSSALHLLSLSLSLFWTGSIIFMISWEVFSLTTASLEMIKFEDFKKMPIPFYENVSKFPLLRPFAVCILLRILAPFGPQGARWAHD